MKPTIDILSGDSVHHETIETVVSFLYQHLEEYGDPFAHIRMAVDYALARNGKLGGFIVTAQENGQLLGSAVVNKTGMGGYIPENVLVYIAVDHSQRGKGIGGKLMQAVMANAEGDIALHVEKDNPARHMYRKFGFTTPFHEMRWKRPT